MAPRTSREYYSTGNVRRYPLRTLKHCENNSRYGRNVDVWKVDGKEDFFRCIGLQMKKLQYQRRTKNCDNLYRKINIPYDVRLRDCRVVILRSLCEFCGHYFKCVTDLALHIELKHQKQKEAATKGTWRAEIEDESHELVRGVFSRTTIFPNTNSTIKLRKKVHVTLRIGKEVIAKMSVPKKYLVQTTTDSDTQLDLSSATNENKIVHESVESRIDSSVSSNSSYQYCKTSMHQGNTPDRYLVSDNVVNNPTVTDAVAPQVESDMSKEFDKSGAASIGKKYSVASESLPTLLPESNRTGSAVNCNLREFDDNITSISRNTGRPLKQILQSDSKGSDYLEKRKDINKNQIENDILISSAIRIKPAYLPSEQQGKENRQLQQRLEHTFRGIEQQQMLNTSATAGDKDSEIQEVLRIIRGSDIGTEINHESPNKFEQQILLLDAIKDMRSMEDQGWHLLEKTPTRSSRQKIRNKTSGPTRMNTTAKRLCTEKCISDTSEHTTINHGRFIVEDSTKENFLYDTNINISADLMRRYNCILEKDTFEINNNAGNMQESVSDFPVSCSNGIQNRSNRPILIDLVNETEE